MNEIILLSMMLSSTEEVLKAPYPQVFLNTCAKCHSGSRPVAPSIPYDDPAKMETWLTQQKKDLIWRRVTAPDGQQMPPNRRLDARELEEIRLYLGK